HWALAGSGVRRPGLWAFVLALLYAFSDEFHQSFVPGRHPDPLDILTDAAGAGAALAWVQWRARRGKRTAVHG
ncbi:MAG: VanZ family protein, partial [Anaerolineae bacterium]|nr:VanZ family protein [Anaerolineae bacterium]